MINKIYKRIHNRYSTLFKFIFFLRYLLGIFFISIVLFLLIPHFYDLKKKDSVIKNYLFESYGLTLNKYEKIEYKSLPTPSLEIQNANVSIETESIQLDIARLSIYPKLINLHSNQNFSVRKIIFDKSKTSLLDSDLNILIDYIYHLKNKLTFKDLNIKIFRNKSIIIHLKRINFSNFGYNKNLVKGEIFNKKFKILISDNFHKINFKLFKTGIVTDINFNEIKKESKLSGIFKSKFLNSNLKFNFDYDDEKLKINNSFFRNKDLSFNNESVITFEPFFFSSSIINIEDINIKLLKNIDVINILNTKDFIKKINTNNEINFKSKKFSTNLIDNLYLKTNLAYGRLVFSKKIFISGHIFSCDGEINLLEEYPILYFDCLMFSESKKKFLKEFSINYKNKNELFKLKVRGNINILNKKINFENITKNQDYKATKEDLNYFKVSFESILFNNNFVDIFNLKKIKEFILEIS